MVESEIQSHIRKAVNRLPWARLVRNNTGKVEDIVGRWHTFGLGLGGADLVGWVRPIDSPYARVFAIEVKNASGGIISPEQVAWLTAINKVGGAAAVCNSVDQAVNFAVRARNGELFNGVGPYRS